MKSSLLLILFETLFLCHTIYGDIYPDDSSVISNAITKSERHRRHGSQHLSNNENYQQDEERQTKNISKRLDILGQSSPGNEGQNKLTLGNGNVFNNSKLGSEIKRRIVNMTRNSNKKNESDFEIDKIRDVRSSNRDHIHDRRDSANDENRGLFGASGGISGGLGGNIGGASAGTEFGIKFDGGVGRH